MEVLWVRVVFTASGPGNMQETSPAATRPPSIWAGTSRSPRVQGRVLDIIIPSVTCIRVSECVVRGHD